MLTDGKWSGRALLCPLMKWRSNVACLRTGQGVYVHNKLLEPGQFVQIAQIAFEQRLVHQLEAYQYGKQAKVRQCETIVAAKVSEQTMNRSATRRLFADVPAPLYG
jgi:hypothetical protein